MEEDTLAPRPYRPEAGWPADHLHASAPAAPPRRDGHPSSPACRERRRAFEYVPEDPLLTAAESAREVRIALSTFWRDVAAGRLPRAYYVAPRAPRWRRSELWVALEATRALPADAKAARRTTKFSDR